MPENSIAIISPEGYPNQKKYSIKAVRWIQGIAKKQDIKIHHALNGGETKVCGHYVDGYDPVFQYSVRISRVLLTWVQEMLPRTSKDQH